MGVVRGPGPGSARRFAAVVCLVVAGVMAGICVIDPTFKDAIRLAGGGVIFVGLAVLCWLA